jgi:methionine-rich copper-binding protein CopC
MQSRRFAVVVTLVIIIAFVVVAVAPAFVAAPAGLALHAQLLGSTPKDGSTVSTAEQVTLTFNEDVDPTFVKVSVKGPDGSETEGKPTVSDRTVTQALAAGLPAGEHVVTYRVVSTDGHPVSGSVTFTSTQAPASGSPSPTTTTTPSPSASSVTSPTPTVTTAPTSGGSDGGSTPWLVVAVVGLLAALGLGAGWRTMGTRRTDAETDAVADGADQRPTP